MIGHAWRARTLSVRLVAGVCVVVVVVTAGLSALYVHYLRTYITSVNDSWLVSSLDALSYALDELPRDGARPNLVGADGHQLLADFTRQASGVMIAVARDGRVAASAVFSHESANPAPAGALAVLNSIPWSTTKGPLTIQLGSMGDYRVQGRVAEDGDVLISGFTLARAQEAIDFKKTDAALIALIALAVTAVLGFVVVRIGLTPLRRVAATASAVSRSPLADPNHRITARVPARYADVRGDLGVVGHALNVLLGSVDSALAQRSATDRRIRRFLSDASHELRTPLAAIQGYAELTRHDSPMLPETTDYALERIESEARRMSVLVSDLLLLSRLDERQDLHHDDVDLADVLLDAVNDMAVSAEEHRWCLDVPEEPIVVMGDRARLHQMITNLTGNAAAHTPPGTTVSISLSVDDGDAVIVFSDDGPGIAAEVLPRVFDRFVRADTARSREHGSTGLGLSIVASVAEAHGGSVTATSPSGACFTVRLPLHTPVTGS